VVKRAGVGLGLGNWPSDVLDLLLAPAFELPAGEDGEPAYQVQWPLEPYARIVREHELAPAG
jgi:hypothetical protein